MTVFMISILRIPSLKVASLVLVVLIVYDVFWVFFSSHFFGDNVMVAVATKESVNIFHQIASKVGFIGMVEKIHLPVKLMAEGHVLGLGDIVIPGIIVSFANRADENSLLLLSPLIMTAGKTAAATTPTTPSYFRTTFVGYLFGLTLTIIIAFYSRVAQPALLYLVPSILLPLIFVAWRRGQLSVMWDGIGLLPKKKDVEGGNGNDRNVNEIEIEADGS
jgi:hypothetical protein